MDADQYVGSALPFAQHVDDVDTGVVVEIRFPYVTRWIQVHAHAQDIRVGFTKNGVNANPDNNFFVVESGETSGRLELKCDKIFIRADSANNGQASIVAGYTAVPKNQFLTLTGSENFSGVG
jgi:hypothetical protein